MTVSIEVLRNGHFLAHFVSFFFYLRSLTPYELYPKILTNERSY